MEIKGRLDEALDRQSKYCYPENKCFNKQIRY